MSDWKHLIQKAHDVDGHCDVVLVADLEHAPVTATTPNLACKSVQARLAEQWGYVRAAAPEQAEPVAEVTEVDLHADHQGPVEAYTFLPVGTKLYTTPQPAAPIAQPQPEGWLRAVDEAMVCEHLGVADAADTYEQAKDKLNRLLCHSQDIGAYFADGKAQPQPPALQPLTDDEFFSAIDSAGLRIDPVLALDIKEIVEKAHGVWE